MCCIIIKILGIIWVIGIPLLMLLNPFHKGKTGKNMFQDDNFDNGMSIALWPLIIIWRIAALMWNCTYSSWKDLSNYLEKLGKNND